MTKKYLLMWLLALTVAACTKDDGMDDVNAVQKEMYEGTTQRTYLADWVINQQVVDHTQVTVGNGLSIEHYPNNYLMPLYDTTIGDAAGSTEQITATGYSNNTNYFNIISSLTSYRVKFDDHSYKVVLSCVDGWPTAVYDQAANQWTVTWRIREVTLYDEETGVAAYDPWTFRPELTMMLITTKQIK